MVDFGSLTAEKDILLKITMPHGEVIEIPFQTMKWSEWDGFGRQVVDPDPPYTRANPRNPDELLPNPDDAAYKDTLRRNGDKRLALRVITSLERGGNTFPADCVTALDKLEHLRENLAAGVYSQLMNAIVGSNAGGFGKVEEIANSFRPQQLLEIGDADLSTARVGVESVSKPDRKRAG